MVYDLIPTIKPQWVDEPTVRQVTAWVRNVLTESDHVLTISEFSRREIAGYCDESRFALPPLTVVRLGDELGSSRDETPPLPRFVPRRPFFVCVSTLDVRKNHRLLYDAWQVLAARDPEHCPDLVCLGVPHVYVADLMHEIRHDRSVNGRIHILHGIEDAELAWYYRHCAATIYPSRYEGWGLPVAESLGHGRLCLASNATSIPEISPDLPAFFHPLDPLELVDLVERTLRDPEWVQAREAEIRARFVPTSWAHTARQVRTAIEAATDGEFVREAA
jgi:glycosyltransferase involved in cell wall biosynthesis